MTSIRIRSAIETELTSELDTNRRMPATAFSEGGGGVVCICGADIVYLSSNQKLELSKGKFFVPGSQHKIQDPECQGNALSCRVTLDKIDSGVITSFHMSWFEVLS